MSSSPPLDDLIAALCSTAADWRDPDHEPRAEAVDATLEAPNRFTEESLAFAINQQMHLLKREQVTAWVADRHARAPRVVGVLHGDGLPLAGLQDALAVLLTGHAYRGTVSEESPQLIPAFLRDMGRRLGTLPATFVEAEQLFEEAEAVIAWSGDETHSGVEAKCEAHGIMAEHRLLRNPTYAVAVIDGSESEEEREGLAEDIFLYEGVGCRSVGLVWAPIELSPDPYFEAFAAFRGVFPVHQDTPGTLTMQQALLEATDAPHAYGEGMEFLVSKGEPEVQKPGHLRWAEYEAIATPAGWVEDRTSEVEAVVARNQVAARLHVSVPVIEPGEAHRPSLSWQPGGVDTLAFLASL